jgi:hypothetical protein
LLGFQNILTKNSVQSAILVLTEFLMTSQAE